MSSSGGMVLRSLQGETFRFDPGARCLEFAVTGGEDYRAAYEILHQPADLDRWARARLGLQTERLTDLDLAEAKRLREAIWHCAEARALGHPLPRGHVDQLNQSAALPPPAPRIGRPDRRAWAEPVTSGQVLSTLARDAIDLFTGPLAGRIRRCAGVNCTLLFADTFRPGQRRWCSMQRCGNRAKAREFRQRRGADTMCEHGRVERPNPPPITMAMVSALADPDYLVELEAVAVIPQ